MCQMITIVVCVISVFVAFFSQLLAWIPLILIGLGLSFQLWVAKKRYSFNYIEELSPEANMFLQKYGHYFMMPFASRDFSASTAVLQFAGILLAIICGFKGFWWGVGIGAINFFVMGAVGVALSPAAVLANDPRSRMAHDEVVEFMKNYNQRCETT